MSQEDTGGSAPTWSEGPSVDSMSVDDAKTEIRAIENSPAFADPNDKTEYWSRQRILRRRDALYKHSLGEAGKEPYSGMSEVLEKQGVSKETLESDLERFGERDYQEEKTKAMNVLSQHFGNEDEAKKALTQARGLLHRFAKEEDLLYLEETGLGSDPNFIAKLSEIAEIFKRGGKK